MKLLLATTWKYIRRNPGLSLATIVIMTITFAIGIILMLVNVIASSSVTYLQSQATISILYSPQEKEESIMSFKTFLEKQDGVISVKYVTWAELQKDSLSNIGISEEQQSKYTFENYQIRILRLQIKPDQNYNYFLSLIDSEKNKGAQIIEVVFIPNIVEKLKQFSNTVRLGGVAAIFFLVLVSMVLIYLTIGFTVNRFAGEIEIMQLVGAEPRLIMLPLALQGAFYGVVSALFAYIGLILVWVSAIFLLQSNVIFQFIQRMITTVGLGELFTISPLFVIFGIILLIIGLLTGLICSYLATKRYIKI